MIYAVFGGAELADAKGLQKQIVLGLHQAPSALKSIRDRLGSEPPVPLVITNPNDADLPVSLESITAEPEVASRIRSSKFVAFLRYVGPEHKDHKQLWSSALAAALVAQSDEHVVVDMATRQSFAGDDWRAKLSQSDWIENQVQPGAQKNADGTVTFFTLGMMKFGRPDLEEANIPADQARERFPTFMKAVQTVLTGRHVSVGGRLDDLTFEKCVRAEEAIEHACVQIRRTSQ